MLKPIENQYREIKSLDGLWDFALDKNQEGYACRYWEGKLPQSRPVAVPASYNDLFADPEYKNHIGDVWYQREIRIPRGFKDCRIVLRFGSVTHKATVWLNEVKVAEHQGGYTPFEADITSLIKAGDTARLTVCCNNELSWQTLPPGIISENEAGQKRQYYFHDFFNYAGIHRSVLLCSTPKHFIDDITVVPGVAEDCQSAWADVTLKASVPGSFRCMLRDEEGNTVATGEGAQLHLTVDKPHLWQPGEGYLYSLQIDFTAEDGTADSYTQKVGLRCVEVRGEQFLINHRPFYFKGFGRHEDQYIRGKGFDYATMLADYNLMAWMGANSFRTSHYPYAEEQMDYADEHGIVVIDETQAVGLNMSLGLSLFRKKDVPEHLFSEQSVNAQTQQAHLQCIRELMERDKNRPCVVMWSIANEPDTTQPGAREYFKPLAEAARTMDPAGRPITCVNVMFSDAEKDTISDMFDVLCINRYYGWYLQAGDLPAARAAFKTELEAWHNKLGKPVIVTEYGADTMAGMHSVTGEMWTEEFQQHYLQMCHELYSATPWVVGEHIWNFADFATAQGIIRVGGNKKGLFTRGREPKSAAFAVRKRWLSCAIADKPRE